MSRTCLVTSKLISWNLDLKQNAFYGIIFNCWNGNNKFVKVKLKKSGVSHKTNSLETVKEMQYDKASDKTKLHGLGHRLGLQYERSPYHNILCFNNVILWITKKYSWFHIKGTWSVHSCDGEYLSFLSLVHTGSWGYLFHEVPGIRIY